MCGIVHNPYLLSTVTTEIFDNFNRSKSKKLTVPQSLNPIFKHKPKTVKISESMQTGDKEFDKLEVWIILKCTSVPTIDDQSISKVIIHDNVTRLKQN